MRLTVKTDFALRVLIYLAMDPKRLASIGGVAKAYGISVNHLMKVVHGLARKGYIESIRGRKGGIRLARAPKAIRVGDVVRDMEDDMRVVACFGPKPGVCPIAPVCALSGILSDAVEAFMATLDRRTLADLVRPRKELAAILGPA